jgi:putative transposase
VACGDLDRAVEDGFDEHTVVPVAVVQLCVAHLIRASLHYASKRYWTPLAKDLRTIYTATDETAEAAALETFADA